jgi:hypothetical protein
LGRPFRVPEGLLDELLDPSNPARDKSFDTQRQQFDLPLSARSLQYNLATRKDARLYVAAYSKKASDDQKRKRETFGEEHKDKPVIGYWDRLYFTDEAHYNPKERLQRHRILRRRGTRLAPENLVEDEPVTANKKTLHMYTYVNYYVKGPLRFYNDEEDMLPTPKPPPKPRRSKYESDAQFQARIQEWEAKKPPEVTQESKGAHMTQEYYTKHLLPHYVDAIKQARQRDLGEWFLQEDGDPSHGTKSTGNVAYIYKRDHGIKTVVHPAGSPDLNPVEGCWLILKQRVKKRMDEWDGTIRHLKRLLQEEWDKIEMKQIRRMINELPWRCRVLTENGGKKVRSEHW